MVMVGVSATKRDTTAASPCMAANTFQMQRVMHVCTSLPCLCIRTAACEQCCVGSCCAQEVWQMHACLASSWKQRSSLRGKLCRNDCASWSSSAVTHAAGHRSFMCFTAAVSSANCCTAAALHSLPRQPSPEFWETGLEMTPSTIHRRIQNHSAVRPRSIRLLSSKLPCCCRAHRCTLRHLAAQHVSTGTL